MELAVTVKRGETTPVPTDEAPRKRAGCDFEDRTSPRMVIAHALSGGTLFVAVDVVDEDGLGDEGMH